MCGGGLCFGLKDGECVRVSSFESLFQLLEAGTKTLHCVSQLLVVSCQMLQLCN